MRNFCNLHRHAFTLIELMVVLAILGLIGTIASLSLGTVMDRYQLGRAAETIEAFDGRARRSARLAREPLDTIIRRATKELLIGQPVGQDREQSLSYRLPARVEIVDVRIRGKGMTARDVRLSFGDRGRSPTYAIQLRRGNLSRWLVVLGLSGQVIPVSSEREVDALFAL